VIVDDSGYHAPAHVGKQGRKKERVKMERKAREQELDEDEDWFGKRPDPRDRHSKERPKSSSKKLAFGSSLRPSSRMFDSSAKPRSERSLRDRLSGEFDRPPPTEPRGRYRSNSLLNRIGHQKVE
jgi:protein AIR1/2